MWPKMGTFWGGRGINVNRMVESIFQPLKASMVLKQNKLAGSSKHWLVSISLHVVLLAALGFSTNLSRNEEMPMPLRHVPLIIFVEHATKQKSVTTGASESPEDSEHHYKSNAIITTNKPSLANYTSIAKLGKIKPSVPLAVNSQAFAKKTSEKSAEVIITGPKPSTSITSSSPANKKNVQLNAELLPARDDYIKFLQMIERLEMASGPTQYVDKKNFSNVTQSSSKIDGAQNRSNFTYRSKKTQCSDKAPTAQTQPSDKTTSDQRPEWGSDQTIRITSLVGHGRYATPSTSVRVSDLLTALPQRMPTQYPNASLTVNDLLRQSGLSSKVSCN
jgi:hypothetical protein